MMMNDELRVVTLEELKLQMHEDFEDEDAIITTYGIAAEDVVIDMTRRSYEELSAWEGRGFPVRLKLAILMLAANFHRNREPVAAVSQNPVPFSVSVLVKPFVKLSDRE